MMSRPTLFHLALCQITLCQFITVVMLSAILPCVISRHMMQSQTALGIIIIIYPLTVRVVGAPQMISQPVYSIFSLFSTALWDLAIHSST